MSQKLLLGQPYSEADRAKMAKNFQQWETIIPSYRYTNYRYIENRKWFLYVQNVQKSPKKIYYEVNHYQQLKTIFFIRQKLPKMSQKYNTKDIAKAGGGIARYWSID